MTRRLTKSGSPPPCPDRPPSAPSRRIETSSIRSPSQKSSAAELYPGSRAKTACDARHGRDVADRYAHAAERPHLGRESRAGNIVDRSRLSGWRRYKHDKSGKDIPAGAPQYTVKRLHLVDNDRGLIEGPGAIVKQQGYVVKINHMHPKTYTRLMQFANKWQTVPSVRSFFQTEALFSSVQDTRCVARQMQGK